MSQTEVRLGLTPITKRLAYYFVCRGVGKYALTDHPQYDSAEVTELYPWGPNPANPGSAEDYAGGIKVVFYKGGERIRFVEFNIRCVGGGGREAVRLIEPPPPNHQ